MDKKGKDIPSRGDRSSKQKTIVNNGIEFAGVKLILKEVSRGQILKGFYSAQKLDFRLCRPLRKKFTFKTFTGKYKFITQGIFTKQSPPYASSNYFLSQR